MDSIQFFVCNRVIYRSSKIVIATDATTAVRSELLCFICQKVNIMAFDDIAKISTDFFREEEFLLRRQ